MFSTASVHSVAALVDFRASIVAFRAEGQDALTSLTLDCRKAADWLVDQKKSWERLLRQYYDEVVHAKAELVRRQMVPSGERVPDTSQQEEDLRRAKARYQHAESKLDACRRWATTLDRAVEEFEGPARRLSTVIEIDLLKAAAALERIIDRLEIYAATMAPPPPRPT